MVDFLNPKGLFDQTVNSSSYVQSKQMYDSDVQSGNDDAEEFDTGAKMLINEPGRPSDLSYRAPPID